MFNNIIQVVLGIVVVFLFIACENKDNINSHKNDKNGSNTNIKVKSENNNLMYDEKYFIEATNAQYMGNYKKALEILEKGAKANNIESLIWLYKLYGQNEMVEEDEEKAIQYAKTLFNLLKKEKSENPIKNFGLGLTKMVLTDVEDINVSEVGEENLILKSANRGYYHAQQLMAYMADNKKKEEEWYKKTLKSLKKKAKKHNNMLTFFEIASMYEKGIGTLQDIEEAKRYYEKAGLRGYVVIGNIYKKDGNYTEAEKWYKKAGKVGYLKLGYMYTVNMKKFIEAIPWLEKSAIEQNSCDAKYMLTLVSTEKVKNFQEAKKWAKETYECDKSNEFGDDIKKIWEKYELHKY